MVVGEEPDFGHENRFEDVDVEEVSANILSTTPHEDDDANDELENVRKLDDEMPLSGLDRWGFTG